MLSRSAEYEGAFETRDKTFVGGFWTGERLETSVSLRMFLPWDLGRITGEGSVSFQTRPSKDEGVQKGAMPSATWRCLSGKSERDSIKPSERRRSSRAAELPDLSGLPCVCAVLLLKALPSAVLPLSFFRARSGRRLRSQCARPCCSIIGTLSSVRATAWGSCENARGAER